MIFRDLFYAIYKISKEYAKCEIKNDKTDPT